MIRVKVSSRGSGHDLDLRQFLGTTDNTFDGCRFWVNAPVEEADVWFVTEQTDDDDLTCRVPASRVFFLTAEAAFPPGYYMESPERLDYLRQFARVFTCHDVALDTVTYDLPFLPWMINANHGPSITAPHERDLHYFQELQTLNKPRELSVFCSTQGLTPQHRMRLRFVERLKDALGDRLDWFGNGVNPVSEKWQGLADYRYTIVLENQSSHHVITEKLYDAFLALCFPIYWGAPDVDAFFDPASFMPIDIKDFPGTLTAIEDLLARDPYEQLLPAVVESKNRVLDEYHLYRRIARIATAAAAEPAQARHIRLEPPRQAPAPPAWRRVLDRL